MWTKRVLLFFWICIPFIFFTCFSALARLSSMMWKRRADNLTLFLNLMENHLVQALNKSSWLWTLNNISSYMHILVSCTSPAFWVFFFGGVGLSPLPCEHNKQRPLKTFPWWFVALTISREPPSPFLYIWVKFSVQMSTSLPHVYSWN